MTFAMLSRKSEDAAPSMSNAFSKSSARGLRVGDADSTFEREADRVAARSTVGKTPRMDWSLAKTSIAPLQRGVSGEVPIGTVPPIVHEVLSSPGRPLDFATCAFFEPRFGLDFASIRIHVDEDAATSASSLCAQAYTFGRHIVFNRDSYPNSRRGKAVVAHELSHAVQQWNAPTNQLESGGELRLASPSEERQADRATEAVMTHGAPAVAMGNRTAVARLSLSMKVHSDEDLGDIQDAFNNKNDHLNEAQLRKIRNAVRKVTLKAKDFEVLYAFYDYYSGLFGNQIVLMSAEEEKNARAQDRLAETKPGSDTKLRPDVLGPDFDEARLGSLLLHEFTHTGQVESPMGLGDTQEGHSYAIEYFYAEKAGDKDRMDSIIKVISSGSVVLANLKVALQQTFQWSYAVMNSLEQLISKGTSPYPPLPDLTNDDGQSLMADFVANFASPSARLKKIIEYVKTNIAAFKVPALL